jgi:hypothetical protein
LIVAKLHVHLATHVLGLLLLSLLSPSLLEPNPIRTAVWIVDRRCVRCCETPFIPNLGLCAVAPKAGLDTLSLFDADWRLASVKSMSVMRSQ